MRKGIPWKWPDQLGRRWIFTLIMLVYVLSRLNDLTRELASEEGAFLIPGRFFFSGNGFWGYLGELAPHFNPFHKPPLTSLLIGLFSFLTPDGVVGARLVPFGIGLLVVLLPLRFRSGFAISLVLLTSPFLYAAAGHMQTDPTVGLLGAVLFSIGLFRWLKGASATGFMGAAALVFWLGKLELAAVFFASGLLILPLLERSRRKQFLFLIGGSNAVGAAAFVAVTWLLGLSAHLPFSQSVGHVVGTILRITSGLAAHPVNTSARFALLIYLEHYRGFFLFACLLFPLVVMAARRLTVQIRTKHSSGDLKNVMLLMIPGLLLFLVYTLGGYSGDGFPRYFLACVPPLLIASCYALQSLPVRSRRLTAVAMIAAATVGMLPRMARLWKDPAPVTVRNGIYDYREAVQFAKLHTHKNDLIVGSEQMIWYARDRKWLVNETWIPYPNRYQDALKISATAVGAVLPNNLDVYPKKARAATKTILKSLLNKGAKKYAFGRFNVYLVK